LQPQRAVRRDPGPRRFGTSSGSGRAGCSGSGFHRCSGSGFHRGSGSGFHRGSGSGWHGEGRRLIAAGFSERPNRPRKRPVLYGFAGFIAPGCSGNP